ncbi:MAG: hypothetical protein DME64_00160 [Verrucomicrobia bacterium]|nr:MAG: hypothetical protein DME64_00160 [Verrucomicrobiota bacterium]
MLKSRNSSFFGKRPTPNSDNWQIRFVQAGGGTLEPHTLFKTASRSKATQECVRTLEASRNLGYPFPWILHEMFSACDTSANRK